MQASAGVVKFIPKDVEDADASAHIACPLEALKISRTINDMLQDLGGAPDLSIPLKNVSSKVLNLCIDYCKLHQQNPKPHVPPKKSPSPEEKEKKSYDIAPWEKNFLSWAHGNDGWDDVTFFELILAAEFLAIIDLLDLCMQTLANLIRGKSVEEFRQCFKIKNDWTPEEEERVSKEVECFEER